MSKEVRKVKDLVCSGLSVSEIELIRELNKKSEERYQRLKNKIMPMTKIR